MYGADMNIPAAPPFSGSIEYFNLLKISFTSSASSLFLGKNSKVNGNTLRLTPLKRSSKFGLKTCPVALETIWDGVTVPPKLPTAAPDNAATIALCT